MSPPPPPPPRMTTGVPPPPAPSSITFKNVVLCVIGVFALFWIASLFSPSRSSQQTGHQSGFQVSYRVLGDGSANLTYRNASGGTEQRTVDLPWMLDFTTPRGQFLYLAAQKKDREGNIKALIWVNGNLLQTAQSDSPYGIASVSGATR